MKWKEPSPFGSFFAFTELPDLPYVEVNSKAFLNAAENGWIVAEALTKGASVLSENGEQWSRESGGSSLQWLPSIIPLKPRKIKIL